MKKLLTFMTINILMINASYANPQLEAEVRDLKEKLEKLSLKLEQPENNINLSKKSSTKIQPYGFIRFDTAYHFEGSDKMFNRINSVPLDSNYDNVNDRLFFTPTVTRLGVDIQSETNGYDVKGKIEVDFRGGASQDQLRFRHAYIQVGKWLVGQTTSPFVSSDILPEMLDFQANLGGAMQRNLQVQYQSKLSHNANLWMALEDGSKGTDDQTRLPALTAKIQFKGNDQKSVLNTRALLLQKKTSDDDSVAWGVGVGGIYYLDNGDKLHADYYHVKGDNKFVLYANDGYVLDANKQIVVNEFDSVALGYTHFWNAKWRSTLGLGGMIAKEGKYAELAPNMNKNLYQGWTNIYYNPTKSLTYGLEYVYGQRETFSDAKGTDSRLEAMVRFSF